MDSLSASAHNAAVRAMARSVGAPEDAFLERWLDDYDARGSGRWKTVEDCVVHTCQVLGVPVDRARVADAAQTRTAFIRDGLVLRLDARETLQAIKARGIKKGLIKD